MKTATAKRITFLVDPIMYDRLEKAADAEHRSIGGQVRFFCDYALSGQVRAQGENDEPVDTEDD